MHITFMKCIYSHITQKCYVWNIKHIIMFFFVQGCFLKYTLSWGSKYMRYNHFIGLAYYHWTNEPELDWTVDQAYHTVTQYERYMKDITREHRQSKHFVEHPTSKEPKIRDTKSCNLGTHDVPGEAHKSGMVCLFLRCFFSASFWNHSIHSTSLCVTIPVPLWGSWWGSWCSSWLGTWLGSWCGSWCGSWRDSGWGGWWQRRCWQLLMCFWSPQVFMFSGCLLLLPDRARRPRCGGCFICWWVSLLLLHCINIFLAWCWFGSSGLWGWPRWWAGRRCWHWWAGRRCWHWWVGRRFCFGGRAVVLCCNTGMSVIFNLNLALRW